MPSKETHAILVGVQNRLYKCLFEDGQDMDLEGFKKVLSICALHYDTWEQSIKLEASHAQYAYTNLGAEVKTMDDKIKWYFKLLQALVQANE